MTRLKHKFGYANQRPNESQLDAYKRSLARHYGGKFYCEKLIEWSKAGDTVISETWQLTFVGPMNKRGGGYPVIGETYVTVYDSCINQ